MDDVAILIKETGPTYDAEGNPIYVRTERQVFVRERSVTRSEFYAAAQTDLRPEITLELSEMIDYENESLVRYHDAEFSVIRTYRAPDQNGIELVLERKVENEDGDES